MKNRLLLLIFILTGCTGLYGQKVIKLYPGKAPGSEQWNWSEGEMAKPYHFAYNVVNPTLAAYLPDSFPATGTAVIICPGGAFHTLSLDGEGSDVAKWLNERGIAAFVLKYRVVRSVTDNPFTELMSKMSDFKKLDEENAPVIPLALADGRKAIEYVREHAAEYKINPAKIGIMGFSAGGTVTTGVGLTYTKESRPDFLVPVYAYTKALGEIKVPVDAPPIFICAATDDQLGMAPMSSGLYNEWIAAKHPAELHIYSKGGHGFGMTTRGLPVSNWIERFYDWLRLSGF